MRMNPSRACDDVELDLSNEQIQQRTMKSAIIPSITLSGFGSACSRLLLAT